eukprot:10371.XXX_334981_334542_1 [CDS] Oithona nana genome sequencing.
MEGSDDQVEVDYYSEDYYTEVDVQNTSTFLNTMLDNQPLKDDQVTDEVMDNLPLFPDDDDYNDYGISGYVKPNIGGDSSFSNIRDNPWMVSFGEQNYQTGQWDHHCGGAIISKNAIATASHCFFSNSKG